MTFRATLFCAVASAVILMPPAANTQQWQKTASFPKGSGVTDLAIKQSNGYLFATTGSFDWPNADTGGVHRSTDGGNTWERVFRAYVARVIDVTPDGTIWASVWDFPNEDEGLYSSSDDGDTWTLRYNGAPNNNVFSFAYDPSNPLRMWIGIRSALVLSNDGGVTWSPITPVNIGWWIIQVAVQKPYFGSGRVWVISQNPGTLENHVYWNDAPPGIGWTRMLGDEPTDTLVSMTVVYDSTDAFARDVDGLYVGTSNGKIYKAAIYRPSIPPPDSISLVYEAQGSPSITAFGNIDFAVGANGFNAHGIIGYLLAVADGLIPPGALSNGGSGGVVQTTDLGQSWQEINEGLPGTNLRMSSITAYTTSGATAVVYAGMFLDQNDGGPVYSIEVGTTGVDPAEPASPREYALDQNYPNPFNPVTTLQFTIPHLQLTSLRVFDLLGREVATLVNEEKGPGRYQVTWDASGQTSGVYYYRLKAGTYSETRKLLLIR